MQWPDLILKVFYFEQRGPEPSAHTATMMTDWIEHLRCPRCAKTGDAELFEISPFNNGFRKVPDGFKVVTGPFGKDLHCVACVIPVAP
jgi:hypothetical protein